MNLPNYKIRNEFERREGADLYDVIECRPMRQPGEPGLLRFRSSYQGESSYMYDDYTLRFRYAKAPWRWDYLAPGKRYWNFANEGLFQREINGAWGILHRDCSNPVTPAVLEIARREIDIEIVTGYFDHEFYRWVICEPTDEPLSTISYQRSNPEPQLLEQ